MAWGDGRKRRQKRRAQRQKARQKRKQTRVEGRFDPDVVAARTQGRQQLAGQALELGSKVASGLTGMDLATEAYTGEPAPMSGGGGDVYIDADDGGGLAPRLIAAGVGVLALVVVMVMKK